MIAITIPQANPQASYLALKTEIDAAVQRVLSSGWYIQGEEVKHFEQEFAAWNGLADAIGVGNGTDAIELTLRSLDIGIGAEVITTAHTATATVSAIELAGATPVLVDIDPETYTLDPDQVSAVLTPRARAIIPVHLYGMPADLDRIMAISQSNGLAVLEDCAQAHGALYHDKRVGTFGTAAMFSFYPTKNLGALGDGGLVGVNIPNLGERVRSLAQYGWRKRYVSDEAGMNTRLDELQAAILRCKLTMLDRNNQRRQSIALRYSSALASVVNTPHVPPDRQSVFHLYVIQHPDRDALRDYLAQKGIGTAIHYPVPIHLQTAYRGRLGDNGSFPVTERIASQLLSLPLYPEMTDNQVDTVIDAILDWSK